MGKIKVVVFDLYGTLIYLSNKINPYMDLFYDLDLTKKEIKNARKIALTENFDNLSKFVERIKHGAKIDIAKYEKLIEREKASTLLYLETKDVLRELRKKNIKLGLISNLATPYKSSFFELGLDIYFDEIVFSCDVGFIKKDPRIYQKMVSQIRIRSEDMLMIGNNLKNDGEGPRSIGMRAIPIDRENNYATIPSIQTLWDVFLYI